MHIPLLETDRLVLRAASLDDAEAVFSGWAQDIHVTRYLNWQAHTSLSEAQSYLREVTRDPRPEHMLWMITLDKQVIGSIRLGVDGHKADMGYALARDYWNRGFMCEAAKAVMDFALNDLGLLRVWAVCDIENLASAAVMQKVGMQKEGVLRAWLMHPQLSESPRDCLCYAIVREQPKTGMV